MKKIAPWWAGILLLLGLNGVTAYAHASLLDTNPHNGQVVDASPGSLTLDFSEVLQPDFIDVKLYDWNARPIPLNKLGLTPGKPSEMTVKLPKLDNGTYTVVWSVVSQDGHPVSDSYSFSVGSITASGVAAISDPSFAVKRDLLAVLRYGVEALLLAFGGLIAVGRLALLRGGPDTFPLLKRWIWVAWATALIGTICEWFLYSASLPGQGLTIALIKGNFSLIRQSPFAVMLLGQLLGLLLILLPNMVEVWYWLAGCGLVVNLATGGHAWATPPTWAALVLRAVHFLAIAVWIGGLGYLLLAVRLAKQSGQTGTLLTLRPFFIKLAGAAAGVTAVTGVLIATFQSDWTLISNVKDVWSNLLLVKLGLFAVMLFCAARQERHWHPDGRQGGLPAAGLLRVEWILGMLALLAGVWMSQTAFPIPYQNYTQTVQSAGAAVQVQIHPLQLGNQTLRVQFTGEPQPAKVVVQLDMEDMQMDQQAFPAARTANGVFETKLPFTMSGNWKYTVEASFPDGSQRSWSDTVFIPREEQ